MADQPKAPATPTAQDIVAALFAQVSDLKSRVETAEAAVVAASPKQPLQPHEDKFGPWEEPLMFRALSDCTYPDRNEPTQFAKFRKGRTDSHPGDVFPGMLRSHLFGATHLEELKGEALPAPLAKKIPQTARGVKVTRQNDF